MAHIFSRRTSVFGAPRRKKKFIVIQKGDPARFVLVMCDTVLIRLWSRRRVRPFIKRDDSLIPIGRQRLRQPSVAHYYYKLSTEPTV